MLDLLLQVQMLLEMPRAAVAAAGGWGLTTHLERLQRQLAVAG